jgi:hypothetical protein
MKGIPEGYVVDQEIREIFADVNINVEKKYGYVLYREKDVNNKLSNNKNLKRFIYEYFNEDEDTKGKDIVCLDDNEKNLLIGNLKAMTRKEKMHTKIYSNTRNKTGYNGVCFVEQGYRAYIVRNGNFKHLGYFDNLDDAINARKQAEEFKLFAGRVLNDSENSTSDKR